MSLAEGGPGSCAGTPDRWDGDPAEGSSLLRHASAPASGGGLILLLATRPEAAESHAAELVTAWMLDAAKGATPFTESLLSTQYDDQGMPTRVGMELWPEDPDGHALRAAGSDPVLASTADGVTAALMHTSADGFAGVGGYLLVRP